MGYDVDGWHDLFVASAGAAAALAGLVLAPQSRAALGIELLVAGACFGTGLAWSAVRNPGPVEFRHGPAFVGYAIELLGTVPIAVAGISLWAEAGGGLYWALAGVVLAVVGAVLNAWVLLVEILR